MNGKQSKKLRQLYNRDMSKQVQQKSELVDNQIKEFTETLDTILKPAPKWIPEFIWVSLQRIFLNT
jgi:hypothetical protein